MDPDLLARYNYDAFTPENFTPWMNFDRSPALGTVAPDFPLWPLEGGETRLSALWAEHTFLVVEFGSFT
ncbi:MAG: hypothetical protein H3C34_22170 [Caldilineaceae bacterium]|nr:hypothetical protein [Caldilineaceae bacterium]